MDSTQIKRIAEQCGMVIMYGDFHERFARAIRNQTLEEAAAECDRLSIFLSETPGRREGGSSCCVDAIRAMKGEG